MAPQASSKSRRQGHSPQNHPPSPTHPQEARSTSEPPVPNALSCTPAFSPLAIPPDPHLPAQSEPPAPSSPGSSFSSDPLGDLTSGSSSDSSFQPSTSSVPQLGRKGPGRRKGAGNRQKPRTTKVTERRKGFSEVKMRKLDREDWSLVKRAKREGRGEGGAKRKREDRDDGEERGGKRKRDDGDEGEARGGKRKREGGNRWEEGERRLRRKRG